MYAKLFGSMFTGSLATRGPWQAVVTFQQFLVLADRFGIVDMTPEAISRHTTIPLNIITEGIEALEQPDPDSRRPDAEGRRIVRLDQARGWGWEIVNHAQYRQIRSAEERRDYQRAYMRDYRKGARRGRTAKAQGAPNGNGSTEPDAAFAAFWQAYPRHTGRAAAIKAWTKLAPDDALRATLLQAIEHQRAGWTDPQYIPHPATWLNGRRWQDEPQQPGQAAAQRNEPGSAPRPSILCEDCGVRAYTWTGRKCDACYRK